MTNTSYCFHSSTNSKKIQKLKNNILAIFTNNNEIQYISLINCEIIGTICKDHFPSNISYLTFSLDAQYIAYAIESSLYIFQIETQKIIQHIKIESNSISVIEFDAESNYIFVATDERKILQYKIDCLSLISQYIFDLSSSINSMIFFKSLLATKDNNGNIALINLYSKSNKISLKYDSYPINTLCFVDSNTLLSGDENGNIYISALKNSSLIKKIETGFTKIKQILLMPNPNYIIVVGDANYVSVYDIKNYKLIHHKYLSFNTQVDKVIYIDDYTLCICCASNKINKIELASPTNILSHILHNSLKEAYELIEKDNTLKESLEYIELETLYKKIYLQALELLIEKRREKALVILAPFKDIK